jgi:DNA-binding CsgD family transcriptional regulator
MRDVHHAAAGALDCRGIGKRVSLTIASLASPHRRTALFCIGPGARVLHVDRTAAEYLGCDPQHARRLRCYDIAHFRSLDGDLLCADHCPFRQVHPVDPLLHHVQIVNAGAHTNADHGPVDLTSIVMPGADPSRCSVIHLLAIEAAPAAARGTAAGAAPAPPDAGLSPRECEVLDLLARGQSTRAIAQMLFISPATVRNHVRHILSRMAVHSRLAAVLACARDGCSGRTRRMIRSDH